MQVARGHSTCLKSAWMKLGITQVIPEMQCRIVTHRSDEEQATQTVVPLVPFSAAPHDLVDKMLCPRCLPRAEHYLLRPLSSVTLVRGPVPFTSPQDDEVFARFGYDS